MKIGLVLSGGGAKGAYQAGIVEALAECNLDIAMISGASIGALNGAIVSASGDIRIAAERLGNVWTLIAEQDVLNFNSELYPRYLAMLAGLGLASTGIGQIGFGIAAALAGEQGQLGLVSTSPLSEILDSSLNPAKLTTGIPLYVSLYPYRGHFSGVKDIILGDVVKRFDTQQSVFKHIQSLNHEEQREALLASAALPVLFSPRKVEGELYSDGGLGNFTKAQGNTPITPLVGQGLDVIIVSHLEDGSLWDAGDFPSENILELRPSRRLAEKGIRDMLGFDAEAILRWRQQGRADTKQTLDKLMRFAGAKERLTKSSLELQSKIDYGADGLQSPSLESAMQRLKGQN